MPSALGPESRGSPESREPIDNLMLVHRVRLEQDRRERGLIDGIGEALSLEAEPLVLGVRRLALAEAAVEEVP